ncbi:MAG: hypothetical protein K2W96_14925, partial [Gemmataceae bacterium]|nr:hypothetical protein [Gemmataceae bacterium]
MPPVLPKLLVQALALTGVPVGDFLGPTEKSTTLHIAWEDKWAALQAFAEGRPKEHDAVLKRLREQRASASELSKSKFAGALEYEKLAEDEKKRKSPDQEDVMRCEDNMRSLR